MVAKVREKGARLQPEQLAQFRAAQPLRGMDNQMGQGLFQIAVLREEDPLILPQAVLVEIGDLRQRVVTAIVVIACVGSPGF